MRIQFPDDNRVSVVKCSSYDQKILRDAFRHLLEPWGGLAQLIKPGAKILIKPNFLTIARVEDAVTTHPEVIRALAGLVAECGAKAIISDSSASGSPEKIFRIAEQLNLIGDEFTIVPMSQISFKKFSGFKERLLPMAGLLDEVDFIINLGKLKTHTLTGLTGAVKNMFGCIVGAAKKRYHLENPLPINFAELLLDIYLCANPGISILDAVVAMEGPGPRGGRPVKMGLLLAGRNGIAVDRVAAEITGFKTGEVPVLKVAARKKMPGSDMTDIQLLSPPLSDIKPARFDKGPGTGGLISLLGSFPLSWFKNWRESLRHWPEVIADRCTGCGECVKSCPVQVINIDGKRARIILSECIRCYCCQEICSEGAITLK